MHISDLHRSGDDHISNTELLSCLITDCERFSEETTPISIPEAIVVSGDLVQGLPLDSPDYPKKLERQYDEALELLVGLADKFIGGDRSKVIIVPGNHDVDWTPGIRQAERFRNFVESMGGFTIPTFQFEKPQPTHVKTQWSEGIDVDLLLLISPTFSGVADPNAHLARILDDHWTACR